MKISLRQLQVFSKVANEGMVTRAAVGLNMSQPATSMALSDLEGLLGERLFDRLGNKLVLNDQGKALLPMAMDILARVQEIEETFGDPGHGLLGALKMGASSTIGNYLIPSFIGDFVTAHPSVNIMLEVGNTENVIKAIEDFKIDLGLIEGICQQHNMDTIPWRQDRLAVFVSPKHELAAKNPVNLTDLIDAHWVLREKGSGTRTVFENSIGDSVSAIQVHLELGHSEAVKNAIMAGLGIGCLSELVISRELANQSLVELQVPFWNLDRSFYLVIHKEKYRSRLLKALFEYLQSEKLIVNI